MTKLATQKKSQNATDVLAADRRSVAKTNAALLSQTRAALDRFYKMVQDSYPDELLRKLVGGSKLGPVYTTWEEGSLAYMEDEETTELLLVFGGWTCSIERGPNCVMGANEARIDVGHTVYFHGIPESDIPAFTVMLKNFTLPGKKKHVVAAMRSSFAVFPWEGKNLPKVLKKGYAEIPLGKDSTLYCDSDVAFSWLKDDNLATVQGLLSEYRPCSDCD